MFDVHGSEKDVIIGIMYYKGEAKQMRGEGVGTAKISSTSKIDIDRQEGSHGCLFL